MILNIIERYEERIIVFCIVFVIFKYGERWLLVNCFFDEGSDIIYVNKDVIEILGISI